MSTTNLNEIQKKLKEFSQSSAQKSELFANLERGVPWGNAIYRENQRNLAREKNFWRTEIQRLNELARAAPTVVENPQVGDFKRGADGFLYRWSDKALYNARTGRPSGPHWAKVLRKFNYEPDLTNAIERHKRIGFQHQYPEPNPPINNLGIGRTTTRRQRRNRKRANRKTRRN